MKALAWENRLGKVNTGPSEKLSQIEKRAYFIELRNADYNHHNHIYTDGSKLSDGVGCSVHSSNINMSICLPDYLSIFSAEAYAIIKAIENCPSGLNVIFSDSKSVLEAVARNNLNHPWTALIIKELHEKRGSIELCWVPAHANIEGNEKADLLAKQGAAKNTPTETKIPFGDFKLLVNTKIFLFWCTRWNNSNSKLREIENTPHEWSSSHANDRHINRVITRLRIGHTRLTHGHFARKETPAICTTCAVQVTVKHIFIDCRKYDTERRNNQLDSTLQKILGDDEDNL
ncbi:uncharacterized protein LOC129716914 [Wyeomyia smithii]|uniref:uncharacterized protein LOC129716914 n=1 Tax=Wyeomyia smithii TaxID=174621 RepID=UPI002467E753|nr:uncharacterized protein LOC129716914 [Wyeomyia smithii]